MDKQDLYEQIEDYLDGRLPPAEQAAFEQRIHTDEDFGREVALHRLLRDNYQDPQRLLIRQKLAAFAEEQNPGTLSSDPIQRTRWWGAAGLLLLLIALGLWWLRPVVGTIQPETATPTDTLPKPAPGAPIAGPDHLPQNMDEVGKKSERPKPDPARFAMNASMEALISSNIRGSGQTLEITHPANGMNFTSGQQIRFSGRLGAHSDNLSTALDLLIFDNANTRRPLHTLELLVKNGYYDMQFRERFKPGLYYFTVELAANGDVLGAGKFTVDKE